MWKNKFSSFAPKYHQRLRLNFLPQKTFETLHGKLPDCQIVRNLLRSSPSMFCSMPRPLSGFLNHEPTKTGSI